MMNELLRNLTKDCAMRFGQAQFAPESRGQPLLHKTFLECRVVRGQIQPDITGLEWIEVRIALRLVRSLHRKLG